MTNVRIGRVRMTLGVVVAALACLAASAGPAAASDLQAATTTCNAALAHPFLPWLDPALYAAAPGGSLEAGGPAWQLGTGTSLVTDNEPWHVGGAGSRSLLLHAGSSAVSPSFCIGLLHPTVRMFARSGSFLLPSVLAVSVEIDTGGGTLTLPVGAVTGLPGWAPSLPLPLLANATSILGGSFATARLRLTAVVGDTRIDDVYVDPFKTS
jgi:hypothetical protein